MVNAHLVVKLNQVIMSWKISNVAGGCVFDDEYYAVTYAKPVDEGTSTHVTFDAVHQFLLGF